jgi:hypothetical protein
LDSEMVISGDLETLNVQNFLAREVRPPKFWKRSYVSRNLRQTTP